MSRRDWKKAPVGTHKERRRDCPTHSGSAPITSQEARGMAEPIRFDDSAAYEQSIGTWSRMTGDAFLAWLAPASGQRWIDVGCEHRAFSARIVQQCAPPRSRASTWPSGK